MPVEIRPMTVDDFAQVYRLGLDCYDVLDKPYNYWTIGEVANHLQYDSDLCYVAEDGGHVVGFALGAAAYEVLENTGHLEWIAVSSDHRRLGIAARLIETIMGTFKRMGKVQVVADVSSENRASRGLFGKQGFTEGISVTFFVRRLHSTART